MVSRQKDLLCSIKREWDTFTVEELGGGGFKVLKHIYSDILISDLRFHLFPSGFWL